MGTLLFDEQPIVIDRKLAKAIGLKEAIVVQQIHYWIMQNEKAGRNFRDGRYWTYNSYPRWTEEFGLWCERTVKSIFSSLEKSGILVSGNYNKSGMDQTKWYTIDYEVLSSVCGESPSCKSCPMDSANFARPIPEINTENNIRFKDKGLRPVIINAREREAEAPPKVVDSEAFSTPDINEPTHRLIKEFGEDRAHEAMAMVARYVEKWYPRYCEKTHRNTKRSKRAECAANILECMDTFHLRYADINEALSAIFDSVLLGQKCGAGGNKDTDPTIVYATTPRVLGHWLMKTGAVTEDELEGTIYASKRE